MQPPEALLRPRTKRLWALLLLLLSPPQLHLSLPQLLLPRSTSVGASSRGLTLDAIGFTHALPESAEWYNFDLIDELGHLPPDSLQQMPARVLTSNNSYLSPTLVHDEKGKAQTCFHAYAHILAVPCDRHSLPLGILVN